MIERSVATATTNIILPESLALSSHKRAQKESDRDIEPRFDIPPSGINLDIVLADIERTYLLKALDMSGGIKQKAAEILGISFRSLRYRLEKLGIEKEGG